LGLVWMKRWLFWTYFNISTWYTILLMVR
jgi:hypothetical protein